MILFENLESINLELSQCHWSQINWEQNQEFCNKKVISNAPSDLLFHSCIAKAVRVLVVYFLVFFVLVSHEKLMVDQKSYSKPDPGWPTQDFYVEVSVVAKPS